ncbi:serine/threonine protein kinase [Plectonema cf. radiosum LEGE 06105]|uniref:non-specific serine/threonine protein kinase n=1 Tax=Plectonema cf. radiosum LEGE 06105 TaxID=945769 RepID=A0A8J7FHK5_9CYAN|nr:serine/threonine-protein kinase [Plectonema radiosum]MBE9216413.1 serine/threonine protein kinase [Plectonema cf. radiosum LEGE 06105]
MSYCLNPSCPNPQNTNSEKFCLSCGSKLLLKQRYRAMKPIGQGGFSRTFLARDEDKPSFPNCVIKQFYPQAQGTSTLPKAIELFNQEAMRLDELGKHRQIPELLAYFTQDDRQYLVQEFIDGLNLAQELNQNGVYNETQIQQLLNELLRILQFCHQKQVIHRDIKPENIIRRHNPLKMRGQIVLVDFGASKVVTQTSIHQTGTSIGTPEYVAPEQMRGKALFASDIYSLAVTCIHLLTARSPFDLYDINNDVWLWRNYLKVSLNDNLGRILDKMLATTPARRYQTVDDVLTDLNSLPTLISHPGAVRKPVQTSSNPIPSTMISSSQSQIDQELEEMKTIFMKGNKSNNNSSNPPEQSTQKSTKNSKIDDELEELRAKYQNNNNS